MNCLIYLAGADIGMSLADAQANRAEIRRRLHAHGIRTRCDPIR